MARPEQVPHGSYHHKIVITRPENIDCNLFREIESFFTDTECTLSDDEVRAQVRRRFEEKGYPSGTRAKVVMVSRFGDCGITKNLEAEYGYDFRCLPECLEIVTE